MIHLFKKLQKSKYKILSLMMGITLIGIIITIWFMSNESKESGVPSTILSKEDSVTATNIPNQESSDLEYNYDLSSLDFMDEKYGWVIKWNYSNPDGKDTTSLLHTENGGEHWEVYESKGCLLQQISFIDSERGWALAAKGNHILSDGNPVTYQILFTLDGGRNWTNQMECEGLYGASCEIEILEEDNACAIISGKIYRTNDSGKSWDEVESPVEDFNAEHVYFSDNTHGWISGVVKATVYVLYTSDGGKSYRQQFTKDYGSDWMETIGVSFADGQNGWFLTCNYGTFDGELYHTTNGGSDWEMVNKMMVCRPYAQGLEAVTPEILWIPMHAGAGPVEGSLQYSQDSGASFKTIGSEAEIVNSNKIEFVTPFLGWMIMNGYPEKCLMKTVDGGKSWEKISLPSNNAAQAD